MKKLDFIRLQHTFSMLGKNWNFSREKVQKNTEKLLEKSKQNLKDRCSK